MTEFSFKCYKFISVFINQEISQKYETKIFSKLVEKYQYLVIENKMPLIIF